MAAVGLSRGLLRAFRSFPRSITTEVRTYGADPLGDPQLRKLTRRIADLLSSVCLQSVRGADGTLTTTAAFPPGTLLHVPRSLSPRGLTSRGAVRWVVRPSGRLRTGHRKVQVDGCAWGVVCVRVPGSMHLAV